MLYLCVVFVENHTNSLLTFHMKNITLTVFTFSLILIIGTAYAQNQTVGCCKSQPEGGASCETITSQACREWGGTAMSSCQECWESVELEQPKVSCCFSAEGSGYGCEQWTRQECVSRNGTAYNSCSECWDKYERERQERDPKIGCCKRLSGGGGACGFSRPDLISASRSKYSI